MTDYLRRFAIPRLAAVAASAALVVGTPARADAQSSAKAACIAAFEQGAELRVSKKLLQARQRLLECSGTACAADVQQECAKELDLVNQSLPSVVFAARDRLGHDVVEGRVLVDGAPRPLDGRAIPLDPGRHTVRFELGGCEPAEQLVLLVEGERNRAVIGSLSCGAPAAPIAPPSESSGEHRSLVLPAAFGAVGLIGAAGFTYFGLRGRAELDDIRATGCAPACNRDSVMNARSKLVTADVFGVVGLAGFGAAAWFAFFAPSSPGVDVQPARGGATATLRTTF